jgi:hypothetical protein
MRDGAWFTRCGCSSAIHSIGRSVERAIEVPVTRRRIVVDHRDTIAIGSNIAGHNHTHRQRRERCSRTADRWWMEVWVSECGV